MTLFNKHYFFLIVTFPLKHYRRMHKNKIFVYNNYLNDDEFNYFISKSSLLMIAYKQVETSSGILLHGLMHKKNFIVTNKGFIGELIKSIDVGIKINQVSPEEIGCAINMFMENNERYHIKDSLKTREFIKNSFPKQFADTLLLKEF